MRTGGIYLGDVLIRTRGGRVNLAGEADVDGGRRLEGARRGGSDRAEKCAGGVDVPLGIDGDLKASEADDGQVGLGAGGIELQDVRRLVGMPEGSGAPITAPGVAVKVWPGAMMPVSSRWPAASTAMAWQLLDGI